jgi:hypothetical protein
MRGDVTTLQYYDVQYIDNDERFNHYIIYGDPAYGKSNHFGTPFMGSQLTEAQKEINRSMSSVRVSVEWMYGQLVQYWPHVDFKKKWY